MLAFLNLPKNMAGRNSSKIAYERGVTTEEALEDFLKADLSHLHDPYLLHDMDKAVARIRQAN